MTATSAFALLAVYLIASCYARATGLAEGCGHVKTTSLNKAVWRLGSRYRALLKAWFAAGVLASVLLCAASTALLVREVFASVHALAQPLSKSSVRDALLLDPNGGAMGSAAIGGGGGGGGGLQLLVPGVTVSWTQLPLLLTSAALALALHEFGHAAAAAGEGVALRHVGLMMVGGLVPSAYVSLDRSALESLPLLRKLRVVCGGVWHNVVLCALALGARSCLRPLLLLLGPLLGPLGYRSIAGKGGGLAVASVARSSALTGHVSPGMVLMSLNGCPVGSGGGGGGGSGDGGLESWLECVHAVERDAVLGGGSYCAPAARLRTASLCFPDIPRLRCSGDSELCFTPLLPSPQLPREVGLGAGGSSGSSSTGGSDSNAGGSSSGGGGSVGSSGIDGGSGNSGSSGGGDSSGGGNSAMVTNGKGDEAGAGGGARGSGGLKKERGQGDQGQRSLGDGDKANDEDYDDDEDAPAGWCVAGQEAAAWRPCGAGVAGGGRVEGGPLQQNNTGRGCLPEHVCVRPRRLPDGARLYSLRLRCQPWQMREEHEGGDPRCSGSSRGNGAVGVEAGAQTGVLQLQAGSGGGGLEAGRIINPEQQQQQRRQQLHQQAHDSSGGAGALGASSETNGRRSSRDSEPDDSGSDITVVFVSDAVSLLAALRLSRWGAPASRWAAGGLLGTLPDALASLLGALYAVSAGMAAVNCVPAYWLDGQAAFDALLEAGGPWGLLHGPLFGFGFGPFRHRGRHGGGLLPLGFGPSAGNGLGTSSVRQRRAVVRRGVLGAGTMLLAGVVGLHAARVCRVLLHRWG